MTQRSMYHICPSLQTCAVFFWSRQGRQWRRGAPEGPASILQLGLRCDSPSSPICYTRVPLGKPGLEARALTTSSQWVSQHQAATLSQLLSVTLISAKSLRISPHLLLHSSLMEPTAHSLQKKPTSTYTQPYH